MKNNMDGRNKNASESLGTKLASAFLFVEKLSCNAILAQFAARVHVGVAL